MRWSLFPPISLGSGAAQPMVLLTFASLVYRAIVVFQEEKEKRFFQEKASNQRKEESKSCKKSNKHAK